MKKGLFIGIIILGVILLAGYIILRTPQFCCGPDVNLDNMNDKVEADINKLFVENQKVVLYLPEMIAVIKQGNEFGLGFGIKNVLDVQEFSWQFKVVEIMIAKSGRVSEDLNNKCGVDNVKANSWIITGKEGKVTLNNNEVHVDIARIKVPKESVSDSCIIKYELIVKKENGEIYDTSYFEVDIR